MQKIGNAVLPTAKRNKNLVSCKTKRLAALALLFICSTGYALADAGSSAITQTVGTFGGCAALIAMAAALPKFFGY